MICVWERGWVDFKVIFEGYIDVVWVFCVLFMMLGVVFGIISIYGSVDWIFFVLGVVDGIVKVWLVSVLL